MTFSEQLIPSQYAIEFSLKKSPKQIALWCYYYRLYPAITWWLAHLN